MLRKITKLAAVILLCAAARPALAATISPSLQKQLTTLSDGADAGLVIVSFNTGAGLKAAHLDLLRSLGIARGITFERLGMVAVPATAGQVRALAARAEVRSVWSNDRLYYYDNQARMLAGVERVRGDRGMQAKNGGLAVSGKGDFSVLVIDSGVDATHEDLKLGRTVIQNVQVLTSSNLLAPEVGFTPPVNIENVPNTDQSVGHGTHCAGIIAGSGARSSGKYAGVAPGAKVIGAGLGAGIYVLNALGAWEWALVNQFNYNIRVVSNSYGSSDAFNPENPINVASKQAFDSGMVVVFAGANSGPTRDTWNKYAKAPWVIGVAAGTKEGGLASFSSRGTPAEERLTDDDPLNDYDAPTITAPGTGREFDSNASKFTAAYVSTRSTSNVSANGLTDDAELDAGYLPFYTQISGTSMATPYVAGVVALMLDADPTLSPEEVKQIITETATRMPGYADHEVGAGYVNAYAAVDKVFNRAKSYNSFNKPAFNAQYTVSGPQPRRFQIDFNPAALPGPDSANAVKFDVIEGMNVLDILAKVDTAADEGTGNLVGIVVTAPDGTTYSSGIQYPVIGSSNRGVVVQNPKAGQWVLEVRGARGLVAVPGVSLPTSGAAPPGPVAGVIIQKRFDLVPVADIQDDAAKAQIELALKSRRIDTLSDGLFHPEAAVTREDFARTLLLNAPVRQSLGSSAKFADVSGPLAALAEALTANGSTLRDWNFAPAGLMSADGTTFNPSGAISRLDLAVAFVRALGLDTEARNLAGTDVKWEGGTVTDNAQIPSALRGYVQLALDRGLLEAFPMETRQVNTGGVIRVTIIPGPRVEPASGVTRAALAAKVNAFAARFAAGN
jgi:serine protease AprX